MTDGATLGTKPTDPTISVPEFNSLRRLTLLTAAVGLVSDSSFASLASDLPKLSCVQYAFFLRTHIQIIHRRRRRVHA
jgi:hypothetical protein